MRRTDTDPNAEPTASAVSTAAADASIALHVIYAGRVQGVGFRRRAERLARGFAVGGYVCNLDDGRVELLVEGAPTAVRAFLAAVAATGPNDHVAISGVTEAAVPVGGLHTFTQRR